jgi:hypothetical protein
MHAGATLLRLAPDASRSSPGDGVHKLPSPFCKAGTKRYMLCPHAYGTFDTCASCRSGVRRSNRMEVGRRQGRHSLQRSACARRTAGRDRRWIQSRFDQRFTASNTFTVDNLSLSRACGNELSKLRDLETGRSGNDRQLGRRRRRAAAVRTGDPVWALFVSLSGWASRSGLSPDCDGIFVARCSPRSAFVDRCHSGWSRYSHSGVPDGEFHGSPRICGAAASWTYASTSAEATWTASRQQAADQAAELRCIERRASDRQSPDEQTRSTVIRFGGSSSLPDSHGLASRAQFVAVRMHGATD